MQRETPHQLPPKLIHRQPRKKKHGKPTLPNYQAWGQSRSLLVEQETRGHKLRWAMAQQKYFTSIRNDLDQMWVEYVSTFCQSSSSSTCSMYTQYCMWIILSFFVIGCYFSCRRSWEGNSSISHYQPTFLKVGEKRQPQSSFPGVLHPHCVKKQILPASKTLPITPPALQKSSTYKTQTFTKIPGLSKAVSSLMKWSLMNPI